MASYNLRVPPVLVVPDGQSLNIIPGSTSSVGFKACASYTKTVALRGVVVSIGGTGWVELTQTQTRRCFIHAHAAATTILLMNGGTTDFINDISAATYYSTVKTYALAAKAAGFNKVVVCTTTPNTSAGNGFTAGQNTIRKAANDLLIGNADGAFDAVVDVASDSSLSIPGHAPSGTTYYGTGNMANSNNATYYVDNLHWTAAGAIDAASSITPALTALGCT